MDGLTKIFLVIYFSCGNKFSSRSPNPTDPQREQGLAEWASWPGYQVYAIAIEPGEAESVEIICQLNSQVPTSHLFSLSVQHAKRQVGAEFTKSFSNVAFVSRSHFVYFLREGFNSEMLHIWQFSLMLNS